MWYSGSQRDRVEHYDSHSKHQILFSSFHEGLILPDGKVNGYDEFPELHGY